MLMISDRDRLDGFQRHMLEVTDILLERTKQMALDLSGIKASSARLIADNQTLITLLNQALANNPDPTLQAQVDAIATAENAQALADEVAAVGPTGATGPSGTTGAAGATGS